MEVVPTRIVNQLYNEQLQNLYASRNVIRVIKSRRMRWVGYVALMGEMVGKPGRKVQFVIPKRRQEGNPG
jgi:hypothetical protein